MPFTSPGAAFGGGFEDYLTRQQAQQHQLMLEDLANKREQRLAQAELDSRAEHQDALAQKKVKDLSDQHDKEVKDFQAHVKDTYVKGDRPAPEDVETAKRLNLGGVFRQAAPAMSADTSTMAPAALMEAPPPAATAAGTGANIADTEGAAVPGAMTPGPATFAGTPQERATADLQQRREAFIAKLPPDLKQEAQLAFEAESLGMKTPTGLLSKTGAAGAETVPVYRQNPRTGSIEQVGEMQKGGHVMSEPPPKDTTVHDLAKATAVERIRDSALKEWDERMKPIHDQILNLGKLSDTLDQNSNIADATLAGQIIKTIEGGKNSGVRVTDTAINQIMKNSRTAPENLAMVLQRWGAASSDEQKNGVFFNAEQKKGMRELIRAFRKQVYDAQERGIKWRRKLDEAADVPSIRKNATDADEEMFSEPAAAAGASKPKRTAEQILKDAGL